jgi:hypothetical protein
VCVLESVQVVASDYESSLICSHYSSQARSPPASVARQHSFTFDGYMCLRAFFLHPPLVEWLLWFRLFTSQSDTIKGEFICATCHDQEARSKTKATGNQYSSEKLATRHDKKQKIDFDLVRASETSPKSSPQPSRVESTE